MPPTNGRFSQQIRQVMSAKRRIIAIVLIFSGFIAFLSGIRGLVTFFIVEQIPVVGDLIRILAPSTPMQQLIIVLIGITLFAVGLLLLRRKKQ